MNFTAKFLLAICFIVCSISSLKAVHFRTADSTMGLQLKGRIIKTPGPSSDLCKIELFLNGRVVDSLHVAPNRTFNFMLQRNQMYTIRVTKKDHVSKLVVVNTEFPDEIDDLLHFSFKTNLLSNDVARQLNRDALDLPAAIVHFEPKHEIFVYNESYTKELKRELFSDSSPKKMLARDN